MLANVTYLAAPQTPYLGMTMESSGSQRDFNFETLNASVQASIDAKKQENLQVS